MQQAPAKVEPLPGAMAACSPTHACTFTASNVCYPLPCVHSPVRGQIMQPQSALPHESGGAETAAALSALGIQASVALEPESVRMPHTQHVMLAATRAHTDASRPPAVGRRCATAGLGIAPAHLAPLVSGAQPARHC